jgi:sec-independent protein translocase protein TatC
MGIEQQIITIDTYVPIVLKLIVAFGLVFQMPLVIFVLGCFGMVTSKGLREKRRIAIVIAFVLSMFLTPPDPMSQILMAFPLCILYEISIWAVWLKEKGKRG